MYKLREDVRNIREGLAEYIDSSIWNCPIFFYDEDEEYTIQYREYLEKSLDAVTTVLPTKEPEHSLSMRYKHLNTTPETESDEIIKSGVEELVPIPRECEVTSDDESEYDVPIKDESFSVFTTFSNPLFDNNDDLTSSDDESLPDEDVPTEEFKLNRDTFIDSSPKFDFLLKEFSGELAHINLEIMEADFDLEEEIRFVENLLYDNSSLRPPEELNAEIAVTIVESLSPYPILVEDSNSLMDGIDLFLATDELLPPNIESDGYDSEGDIYFLEEILADDFIPLPENESSNFDHQDINPSFPRPPPEPPDVDVEFEPNSGDVISALMNNIDEPIDDKCFDPGEEIDVSTNVEDDDYFPFMFVVRIFLPYLIYPDVSPLYISAESEDTIFDPESEEIIKSGVEELVQIPRECEVTSDDESEYDVPIKDESFSVFTTFSNPPFNNNDDLTSSDDELLPDEDVPTEEFKLNRDTFIDSNSKFDFLLKEFSGELAHINLEIMEADFDLEEEIRFVENLLYDNSSLRPPEELNAEIAVTIVESLSPYPILVEDSDSLMDEIDLFLATDELLPSNIKSDGYDSEGDIYFLEEILTDDFIPLPENESSNFDHQDINPSFPRPPPEPPDVDAEFEPNSGDIILALMNNIDEPIDDKCFDPGGEIDVSTNVEDDDYFPFMFVVRIFLPYLIYPEVSPLYISAESEDTIFDPGISV
nr:hypothetical protein [Tanacetum cinerariifolium]